MISSSIARTRSAKDFPAPRISSSRTTMSSPIRSAGWPCGAPISSPTSSIAICRSITAARPATGGSSRRWPKTASICGSASTRTAAFPRGTTPPPPPGSGYRGVEPAMAKNRFYLWIGQHETGRYSKAHKHASAAVLVCVKGKGYTYTWPEALGTTPWKDGRADKILRQDYEPGGMVSAAPMSGDWFHQHFGVGKEGLRISAWHGPNNQRARKAGLPGEQLMDYGAIDLSKGGSAIPYHQEDKSIRREFEATLQREGVASPMEEGFSQPSSDAASEPAQLM